MNPLLGELARKSFHMLSLLYLAAYSLIGWPKVLPVMIVWTVIVLALESWRLRSPGANKALMDFFGGLARQDERDKYSGIAHTTVGVLILWLMFGGRDAVVSAGIYFVAFGDASAALVGTAVGRHKIGGGRKSVEGSGACFLVCFLIGVAMGLPPGASAFAAMAATIVELLPTTRWFNDNLWMPVVTAAVLRLCAVS